MTAEHPDFTPESDRNALLKLWSGTGSVTRVRRRASTANEREMAGLWCDIIGVSEVFADDDYFEIGGDSVHAIVIVARAKAAGWSLAAQDLFDSRILSDVAAAFGPDINRSDAAASADRNHLGTPAQVAMPLTPMQQGMLYHSTGGSSTGAYVVQVVASLAGDIDLDLFVRAWNTVIAASSALRVSFDWAYGRPPVQMVDPAAVMEVVHLDHTDVPDRDLGVLRQRLLDEDRDRGFDLGAAPLMRLLLARSAGDITWCVWTYHHLVLDGWSQQLVLFDVLRTYDGSVSGREVAPPDRMDLSAYRRWLVDLPDPDLSLWQEWATEIAASTRIAGAGCENGTVIATRRSIAERVMSQSESERLAAVCRANGVTQAAALHGGFAQVLSLSVAQDVVVFGSTCSGRPTEPAELIDSVAMFINTLPLRVRCRSNQIGEWLRSVQTDLLRLQNLATVPLSRVERALGIGRGGGLFDSILVVENFPVRVNEGNRSGGIVVTKTEVLIDEGYPLVLEVAPGPPVILKARFDESRVQRSQVDACLVALTTFLTAITESGAMDRDVDFAREAMARVFEDVRERDKSGRRAAESDGLETIRRRPIRMSRGEHR